ncbi:MAG: DUF6600 domain-containing protein [Pseudomonadota bacterium]
MKNIPTFKRVAFAGIGAILLAVGAPALADPPSRIARLAYVSGPVSFAPAGENDWENAALNRTLIAGDRLWVDNGARDEVQIGGAALRMGGGTLVTLARMDSRLTRLQMSQGRLNIRVRRIAPNEVFEVDTPNLALTIRQPGDYRIEVDPVGDATMVAVRRGQADVYGDGNANRLGGGQAYRFGGSDLRDARLVRADVDEFDRWSATRDRRFEQSRTARYVSPNLVGYEDLDEQGTWRSVPSYGNVWMPANVGRDWAPYRDGHWSYVQPWGWTWVDNAPWGFAVSHYGRWARFPQGWGWVPGPRAASPVYAPALVAFISIGSGAYSQRERPVAWFPLAPREAYRPSYRASPAYVTNINITNTTFARNQIPRQSQRVDYANRRVGGAVTAVPQTAFVRAQPVSKSAIALPVAALAGAAVANAAPAAPERGARGRGDANRQPPAAVIARQQQAGTAPPPPVLRNAPAPAPVPPNDRAERREDRREARVQRELRDPREQRPLPPPLARAPTPATPAVAPAAPVAPNERVGRREDRREGGRDARTAPPPLANAPAPVTPAAAPVPPVPPNDRAGRRDDRREARPPSPPPLANAPTPAAPPAPPAAAPVPPNDRANRREERREERREARPPSPPPLAHAPTPAQPPSPTAAAPVPPNDRAALRAEMREAREQRRQERAPQPAPAAPPPAAAPAPAAAAPRPPEPPKAEQARAAQPPQQQQPGQNGRGNEKRGEKRDRDRPEKD